MPLAERDTSVIAALADPLRRRLYLFVCAQPEAVTREQAADAVAVPVHQAKFHLDKLETEGLLETDYARVSGRRGPGAGRPSKLYRRAAREVSVSLPDRDYELAGQLMADAIAEAAETGQPVVDTLYRLAARAGSTIGCQAADADGPPESPQTALRLAVETLAQHGYEPRADDARVLLVNCPFHRLAQAQPRLVCGMNHALISGLTAEFAPHCPSAALEPAPGRCCVVLTAGTR
ncbi:transcriptional regulator [Mycolicibacterium pulveris]|uniref:Transcriptional regulator n=1 Tax=Mycolicibacterium pulveris TaxID=36813 RepID=A0A7I7UFM3_MYCPV|nr:transcriptional regulator [Mycolicibacterium pulveris]